MIEKIDNRPIRVFDEEVMELLGKISAELMKSPVSRAYPDVTAFAFFIRKANLLKLRDTHFPYQSNNQTIEHSSNLPSELSARVGRGLCFHVTPSNIPINFAFSWVFGLLAGNANIVRLPSKTFPQVDALLDVIQAHLAHHSAQSTQHQALSTMNAFVRYPRTDTERTAIYCAMADARMIWGGDRTIATIKALPASPRCVDIAFADRYSIALIDGNAVLSASETELARLAENFYNDTYLMDQNACSSPQLICWTGDSPVARTRFWFAVEALAARKYTLQDAVAVDKYTQLCEEAATNPSCKSVARSGNLLYREELAALTPDVINRRGKGGYFFEYSLSSSSDPQSSALGTLFAVVTEKWQTITYFGIDPRTLHAALCTQHARGIDRIVPIGKSMDIGPVWDGYDLIRTLSRVVNVA